MNKLDDLKAELLSRARTLIPSWLPNGKFKGREYVALNPTRCDQRLDSFSINTVSGEWADFATGDKGSNLIGLYSYIHQISYKEAIDQIQNDHFIHQLHNKDNQGKNNHDFETKIRFAKKMYSESSQFQNTHGQKYLNARGISKISTNIRFNSKLIHTPTKQYFPAVVSPVVDFNTKLLKGIHRIYLDPQEPQKAPIEPNKMMLGDIQCGGVPLFRSECPETLIVCEGLETGLSLYQVETFSIFVMLSATNLQKGITFQNHRPTKIIIATDNDKAGLNASHQASIIFLNQGIEVSIAVPKYGKDFNDTLNHEGGA
jgi:phage/plasmid primase-like uncharacterized protein